MDHDTRGEYDLISLERAGGISVVKNLNPELADAGAS